MPSRCAVAGPTPGITVTCIGARNSASVPAGTTTTPSGLSRSLAIFAISFDVPAPTDAVRPPDTFRIAAFRSLAIASTSSTVSPDSPLAARSMNASSSDSGSTSGDSARISAITAWLLRRYTSKRGLRYAACGHRDRASAVDIAERTPYLRASYDAVETTPRTPIPPTTTGLPRSEGLSRCSTAAKNASRSTCSTDGSSRTRPVSLPSPTIAG